MKFTYSVADFRQHPYLFMEIIKAKIELLLVDRNTGFIEFDIQKSGLKENQEK